MRSAAQESSYAFLPRRAQGARILGWMILASIVLQVFEISGQVVNRLPQNNPRRNTAFRADQILVKPRRGAPQAQLDRLHAGINGRVARVYLRGEWLRVRLPPGKTVNEALA